MPDSERKIPKLRSINKERERAITMLVVFGMFVLVYQTKSGEYTKTNPTCKLTSILWPSCSRDAILSRTVSR